MYKGDISNSLPKRVLVNIEPLLVHTTETFKKYKIFTVKSEKVLYDKFLLNKLYLYTTRTDTNLELIAFKTSEDELERMFNEIDRIGTNPFRFYNVYKSPKKLAEDLPYRPEVFGVIDIPENRLMYGKWALDF